MNHVDLSDLTQPGRDAALETFRRRRIKKYVDGLITEGFAVTITSYSPLGDRTSTYTAHIDTEEITRKD